MKILNYNSTLHDIYTFIDINGENGNEDFLPRYLCAVPPSAEEVISNRGSYTAVSYNQNALCVTNTLGHHPDFSGLHVRSRGSNTSGNPWGSYISAPDSYPFLNAQQPYEENVRNLQNWNNGQVPFLLLSSKYFTGCAHFIGNANTANQTISLLGKDNIRYYVEGEYVNAPVFSTFYAGVLLQQGLDLKVYKIIKVNGIVAPDGLTNTQQQQLKIYSIIDLRSFSQNERFRSEVLLWFQNPQGAFCCTTLGSGYHVLSNENGAAHNFNHYTYPKPGGDLFPSASGTVWAGDSGTPCLATWRGETYLVGMTNQQGISGLAGDPLGGNYQSGAPYVSLNAACNNTLLPVTGSPQYSSSYIVPNITTKKYKSGFLEECDANGLPFISNKPPESPAIVTLTGAVPSQIYLTDITISSVFPRFTCSAFDAITGQALITNTEFVGTPDNNAPFEDYFGDYTHGFLALPKKDIYLTYVVSNEVNGSGVPTLPENTQSLLSPLCIDPEVGYVALSNEGIAIAGPPVSFVSGYNYSLDSSEYNGTNSINFNVSPGAGAGKEPCDSVVEFEDVVRSLNRQSPDEKGDIKIQTLPSDCITVDSYYENQAGRISLNAHCAPCCRCQDYKNTSDYIKGAAVIYSNSVKDLNNLIAKYNTLADRFADSVRSCSTAGKINPRFRLWPQQNFKLQIQAMAENNTKTNVRIKKLFLTVAATTLDAITAYDPESQTTYFMDKDSPIAAAAISDASYLYFKNLNPTPKGLLSTIENTGVVKFEANLESSSLPTGAGLPQPNDVEPCTGYSMITAGLLIVDPVFRKIVNLGYPQGVNVNAKLTFQYMGTEAGLDPCANPAEAIRPIGDPVNKLLLVNPNKSSVNPCDSVKASSVTINGQGAFILKFPQPVYGTGDINRTYQILGESSTGDSVWSTVHTNILTIGSASSPSTEFSLAPPAFTFGLGAYQLIVKYSGTGLSTKCKAIDTQDDEVDIPASHFDVGVGFTV